MPDDPDRFLNFPTPGAQEWWYFDAISDDGRDTLVVVWYAALPFDPDYGVATLRHLKTSGEFPAPHALDHCAIGFGWYRDGKAVAYALNGFRQADFRHDSDPFAVEIAKNRVKRHDGEYFLSVDTPTVDGKSRLRASLRFQPAIDSEPLERDLGNPGSPHLWILAAADCRVEGTVAIEGRKPKILIFRGRGYHDHNAGSEELSLAMKRWQWGRAHVGEATEIYYEAEPRAGRRRGLWITCERGRPVVVREPIEVATAGRERNIFGVRDPKTSRIEAGGESLTRVNRRCVDDGPFYRRSLADFRRESSATAAVGITELLDTRHLHRPLFNWMIPYRLKRL